MRYFEEGNQSFITGIKFTSEIEDDIIGAVDLYEFGNTEVLHVDDGLQIVGVHGLYNNLIRGIGFILYNPKYDKG